MAKIGSCSRRCKGKTVGAFRKCLRTCMKKGGAKKSKKRSR